jgi:hypothetical protein
LSGDDLTKTDFTEFASVRECFMSSLEETRTGFFQRGHEATIACGNFEKVTEVRGFQKNTQRSGDSRKTQVKSGLRSEGLRDLRPDL